MKQYLVHTTVFIKSEVRRKDVGLLDGIGGREDLESRYRLKECGLATQQASDVVTTSF